MAMAVILRASWPSIVCPSTGRVHDLYEDFTYDLGFLVCRHCDAELKGFEDLGMWTQFAEYAYYFSTGHIPPTANKWN